jgi:hypothetical protein
MISSSKAFKMSDGPWLFLSLVFNWVELVDPHGISQYLAYILNQGAE